MKRLFAPGCALRNYKPERIRELTDFLSQSSLIDGLYTTCCKSKEPLEEETLLITCCPGCSHIFSSKEHCHVTSLWSVLLDTSFPFPDYQGERMSIHDSCPARGRASGEMQESARRLCERMNLQLQEPALTREKTRCCGGSAPTYEKRKEMALKRAADFPEKNVVCYCTGCVRSLSITPASPRHLLDLLFEEPTQGLYPPGGLS